MTSQPPSVLVVGFALTGQATARSLRERGRRVVAIDDADETAARDEVARELGVELVWHPSRERCAELASRADLVVLSPGVPPTHPIFEVAPPEQIVAEVELAASLASAPIVAVTGTNGKTTVTSLVTEMLRESGQRAEAVGNIGRPFIEVVADREVEVFVLEISSFQLAWTRSFHPKVACWLNLAEDHLDWHGDIESYAAAKASIFANQDADDVAVVNAEDPVVMRWAETAPSRRVTFGRGGDVTVCGGVITSPAGAVLRVDELPRLLPHDVSNACAATATALEAGAKTSSCAAALRRGVSMRHRIELVAQLGGVSYYDDSKATTPSAVLAGVSGFDSVVLLAGGRNKGLDLGAIVAGLRAEESGGGRGTGRLRGVVAIGEAAGEVVASFSEIEGLPVEQAASMTEAVAMAGELARPGDAVVLSPGCASFDWYRNYGERGDDFALAVHRRQPREKGPGRHAGAEGGGAR